MNDIAELVSQKIDAIPVYRLTTKYYFDDEPSFGVYPRDYYFRCQKKKDIMEVAFNKKLYEIVYNILYDIAWLREIDRHTQSEITSIIYDLEGEDGKRDYSLLLSNREWIIEIFRDKVCLYEDDHDIRKVIIN